MLEDDFGGFGKYLWLWEFSRIIGVIIDVIIWVLSFCVCNYFLGLADFKVLSDFWSNRELSFNSGELLTLGVVSALTRLNLS